MYCASGFETRETAETEIVALAGQLGAGVKKS